MQSCKQRNVACLLNNVHFAQGFLLLFIGQVIKPPAMTKSNVLHMTQPVVCEANPLPVKCRPDARTAVVTDHHNVLDI